MRRLAALSNALGRIPSLSFAFLYLASIPVFAWIYTLLPNGFYHTTVQYENVLNADAQNILKQLRDEIIREFNEHHGTSRKDVGQWRIDISNIQLRSLSSDRGLMTFTPATELDGIGDLHGARAYNCTLDVTFEVRTKLAVGFPRDPNRRITKQLTVQRNRVSEIPPNIVFSSKGVGFAGVNPDLFFLTLTQATQDNIVAFADAVRGFPSAATGSFPRMFYFSAVTITTLGYGDIVPITSAARWLVASESILGILLAGLFVNSLLRERKPRTA